MNLWRSLFVEKFDRFSINPLQFLLCKIYGIIKKCFIRNWFLLLATKISQKTIIFQTIISLYFWYHKLSSMIIKCLLLIASKIEEENINQFQGKKKLHQLLNLMEYFMPVLFMFPALFSCAANLLDSWNSCNFSKRKNK